MAIDLTGIHNVGEFYSHHYLDALLEKDLKGVFGGWKREDAETPDKRLTGMGSTYFRAKSEAMKFRKPDLRYEPSHRLHVALLEALGYIYDFDVRYLSNGEAIAVLGAVDRSGAPYLWLVETVFANADENPLDNLPLKEQYPAHENEAQERRPKRPWEDVVGEIFKLERPPRWVIFLAGQFAYLIDRTKWGLGQYLLFDLDEILGRRQVDTLRATAALLSREGLAPEDGIAVHDTLNENSHKHAYGVSSDLKFGVRRAVELLANEYLWYQVNIGKKAVYSDAHLAQELTWECLRYLYRLLFLFYAEARSSELGLVPMRDEAYRKGYSLEGLRDLELVPLNTEPAQNGYYLNDSLNQLFKLVNEGYPEIIRQMGLVEAGSTQQVFDDYGFTIMGLQSPLFERGTTPRLSAAKFRNGVLQEIVQQLSLSQVKKGKNAQRGRISYAQLGINQLGAVYEGLLSYSGFFAQERLYEVQSATGSTVKEQLPTFFIPESDIEKYKAEEFVDEEGLEGTKRRKFYEKGSFIFRLAGRDREKSASYYTPEVLTQCVVKYSLKELIGESPEDENWKTADEILKLTLCEPAMGSGAFINEAINQLADAYLARKQGETGETIAIDDYLKERQKVKAHLALNNAYGADLNPMAVELAQISIWLNTIFPGMPAPWFNARLAVGNSLIGARCQVYSAVDVKSGVYAKQAPSPVRVGEPRPEGSVYHWLLPDTGMAAFDKDKVIKELAPAEVQAIKDWRKGFTAKFKAEEIKQLQQLSDWADGLWAQVVRDRQQLLAETREELALWGQEKPVEKARLAVADKERKLRHFERPNGPYRRLKLAMDYWCALWFWPIPEAQKLPARGEFLADMATVLKGAEKGVAGPGRQMSLLEETKRAYQEKLDLPVVDVEKRVAENERLGIVKAVQENNRFQHWELTFADLFDDRGGFDLILGNPPWVMLSFDEAGLLSDYDPRIALRNLSSTQVARQRSDVVESKEILQEYLKEYSYQTGSKSYLGANQNYPNLTGKTNLYKCFIVTGWDLCSRDGICGLLHPESIFDDPRGGKFRSEVFYRLVAHFQFINELKLFNEVHNLKTYSINVYRAYPRKTVEFHHLVNLFHPISIDECFEHDGHGVVPGIRDSNYNWQVRGHKNRIIVVNPKTLALFANLFDDKSETIYETPLPNIHSKEVVSVFEKIAESPVRLSDLQNDYVMTPSTFWNETASQKDGSIKRQTRYPKDSGELIISGPHFFVATPFYKNPNENCRNNRDYSDIDLTLIPAEFLPRTNYVPACSASEYRKRTPAWNGLPLTHYYRHIHRKMLSITGQRTLINAILPPGAAHIHGVVSFAFRSSDLLVYFSGLCSSIIYDFFIKSTGKANMLNDLAMLLPIPLKPRLSRLIRRRALRLNCLTSHYEKLWEEQFHPDFIGEVWSKKDNRLSAWKDLSPSWHRRNALRTPYERRWALIELDVLAAFALELDIEEMMTIYRVQFSVLQKYDRQMLYDQRGMEVPVKTMRGKMMIDKDHEDFPAMVPPFTPVDREADYQQAWAHFEKRLKEGETT